MLVADKDGESYLEYDYLWDLMKNVVEFGCSKMTYKPKLVANTTGAVMDLSYEISFDRIFTNPSATVQDLSDRFADAHPEPTHEFMGGEDRWADMDAWAVQNLSEEDLSEFNKVMKEGTIKMQKLMIKDLWGQFESAGKPNAPVRLDLERGENIPPTDSGAAVSQAEYFQAFQNGEYRKNPAAWDARRKAGIAKGI